MKRLYLVPLLLFSTTTFALSDEPYIDQEALKYDLKFEEELKKSEEKCEGKKGKTFCITDAYKDLRDSMPPRGHDRYTKKKYKGLSKQKADKILKHYASILEKVRQRGSKRPEPGEITWDIIENEGRWIQRNVFNRNSLEPLVLSTGEVLPFYSLDK